MTRRRQQVGRAGEEAARSYLQRRGYRVAEANFRSPYGEIDLIAYQGSTLVFIEVRTRTGSSFGIPAESVTPEKLNRLKKTARFYMQSRFGRELACRFDLIAVLMDRKSMALNSLRHYRGIIG
ncbi:MAG TPA: YraN family protein [Bacillota bacterium]|nr:YraN family protein [Bacillota bacterium]HOA35684.1 YraN family protein [Bacillota bacterium]HOJ83638.1 YraN family protein [Bacillota bacterium]HOL16025.1 YraN family protein [Bacillota bacterium]HPZ11605.1 YraN family protein [Bacillota bacterium]